VLKSDEILANRYRLILLVGQGTMGAVYDAEDMVFHRRVALKQMRYPPEASERAKEQTRDQFEREAKILATLRHPNLPRVTDYFALADQQFLVMDYIEGQSLEEILELHHGGLEESTVLDWADQLLSALTYIHRHGLVHRDVKPANIRVTPDGHVFLVDFGLVKTFDPVSPKTATAVRGLGTPQYAPPEQYDAELGHTEPRSDLYSLGATMYHLLTGEPPATVTRRVSSPGAFRSVRQLAPTVSPDVERVILRAMEVSITKRFASAGDMREALRLAHAQLVVDPSRTSALPAAELLRARRQQRRRILEAGAGLLVMLGIVVMAFVAAGPSSPLSTTPTAVTPTNPSSNGVPLVVSSETVTPLSATPTLTRVPDTATATATATASATSTATATATSTATPTPSPTRRRVTVTSSPTLMITATEAHQGGGSQPPTKAPPTKPAPTEPKPTEPKPTEPPPPTEPPTPRPTPGA
jgi:eukaryotic-like serine/threonine-protein kinase